MSNYLFLFTITPVQSFISNSRKTRDLFSGSKILTDLIDYSIGLLPESKKIIFPNELLENKPNRFLAEIDSSDEEITKLGDKLAEKIKQRFFEIGEERYRELFAEDNFPKNFELQLKDYLQTFWAAISLNNKEYSLAYKNLEATIGATKNIRKFKQINEASARKCSVCGEYNALFYGDKNMKAYYQRDAKLNVSDLLDNEGLCAICFTKRFYKTASYPSTANIATMNVVAKLSEYPEYLIYKDFYGGYFDHQLLYKENITDKYFQKNRIKKSPNEALELLKKLGKKTEEKFPKYYALIMFDGDSMGKWLSGENLKEGISLKDFHKELTKAIGQFAKIAQTIISEPKGKVIYAGGEDFLGFVNLSYLFDVIKDLRENYDSIINLKLKEYVKDNSNFSFSAGIVVSHYKLPLSEVLNWARKLEKNAKDLSDEKNAFSLAVLKHSGEIHQTTYKWGSNENLTRNFNLIGFIQKKLNEGVFSSTFIVNLRKEMMLLCEADWDKLLPILSTEIKRLVKKSFMLKRTEQSLSEFKKLKEKEISEMISSILLLAEENTEDLNNFFYALEIADFIHRKLEGGE